MIDEPAGLAMGEAFRRYVTELRESWPVDEQRLAAARGDAPLRHSTSTVT